MRDEHGQRVLIEPTDDFHVILPGNPPVKFKVDTFLYDDRRQVTGEGWVAVASIWDGDKTLGTLNADNLLQQKPPSPYQLELLRLFGITLGNLITRQRTEAALQAYSEQLEEMVKARTIELEATQERLVRQEKLAFLGQLAGGIGHELRNPLGVINNALYYLNLVIVDANEAVREYLNIIAERVAEADKIVGDLLNLSRNRTADRNEVALYPLITSVLARHQAPEGIRVETHLPSDLPALFVDGQQLRQVLSNLVTNAYQAMPSGGTLTIAARMITREIKEQEDAADNTPIPALELTLVDTGQGMSTEVQAKIFEPLYTTKAKGIGLGLAISKKLLEANGGDIAVASIEGQGSTFTLLLPVHTPGDRA